VDADSLRKETDCDDRDPIRGHCSSNVDWFRIWIVLIFRSLYLQIEIDLLSLVEIVSEFFDPNSLSTQSRASLIVVI
jgi:hypothetical protein